MNTHTYAYTDKNVHMHATLYVCQLKVGRVEAGHYSPFSHYATFCTYNVVLSTKTGSYAQSNRTYRPIKLCELPVIISAYIFCSCVVIL